MDRQLHLAKKKDWTIVILAAVIIIAAVWQIFSAADFQYQQLFLFAGALFLIFYALMPSYVKFNSAGRGSVESRVWQFISYKYFHHEDLSNAKAIIIRKVNRWGEIRTDSRILLFEDGTEILLPEGDQIPPKIVNWFEETFNVALPVIDELIKSSL
jgi:hypothetical protein